MPAFLDPSAVRRGRVHVRYFRESFAQGGIDLVQIIPELVTNADAGDCRVWAFAGQDRAVAVTGLTTPKHFTRNEGVRGSSPRVGSLNGLNGSRAVSRCRTRRIAHHLD
jgi:hypothetical protein